MSITVTQEMHAQVQPGYKICADCGQLLALDNYHYNARASDLRVSTCRSCLKRQRAARKARSKLPEPEPVTCQPSIVSPALFDPAEVVAGWDAGETIQSLSEKHQRTPKHISRIIRAAGRGKKRPIPDDVNTRRWTPAEDDLIRSCSSPTDAMATYEAEYPKKRTQNAIRKHYHDLRALGRSQ
jgi:hypothetical protein